MTVAEEGRPRKGGSRENSSRGGIGGIKGSDSGDVGGCVSLVSYVLSILSFLTWIISFANRVSLMKQTHSSFLTFNRNGGIVAYMQQNPTYVHSQPIYTYCARY